MSERLDEIIEVFRAAGATPEDIRVVEDILERLKRGEITELEAYYALLGLATERMIPLTPRQVSIIRSILIGG